DAARIDSLTGRFRTNLHYSRPVWHSAHSPPEGASAMRVVLIIAALLLVAVSAAAVVPVAVVPVAEPFRQYLPPVALALAILVLIGVFAQPRRSAPQPTPAAEPARPVPERPQASRADAAIVHFLSM